VVAITFTGLAAGVFLGHRLGVSLAMPELTPSSFVQLQQIIHVHFAIMMPILIIGAVAASIIWTILLRARWRAPDFWLVSAASFMILCVVILTRTVNVPINDQLMTWSIQSPPPDLVPLWRPWEEIHSIRTVLTSVAFGFQVVAVSAFAPPAARPQGKNAA
jgi:uncharacterized membrane protein